MEAEPQKPVFERVEIPENSLGIPVELKTRFAQYPVFASGQWKEDQLMFNLRWEGGYTNHLDPVTRADVSEEYRNRWHKAIAPKAKLLNSIKGLPMDERKRTRRNIMPFPGVTMTFEEFDEDDGKLVIRTRVGNYAQIHPDFGICTPSFTTLFPGHLEELLRFSRGMGIQILTETSDNYHIFGLNTGEAMGAGFVGTLGITPNISDDQIKYFVARGEAKSLEIPYSWLSEAIKDDLSEPDELNLDSINLKDSAFKSISFIGAIDDPKSGWMTLIIFCKLHITSSEAESLWSNEVGHQYANFVFVKHNPQSLVSLLSRPNLYPALYGGYHAYFKMVHPSLL